MKFRKQLEIGLLVRCQGDDTWANVPDEIREIGRRAFSSCRNLKLIILPQSLSVVHPETFIGCQLLQRFEMKGTGGTFWVKDGLLLEKNTLVCCPPGWSGVCKLPEDVRFFRENAFSGCVQLEEVVLPQSLITIPPGLFSGCSGLKRISIPKNIRYLDASVFEGCRSLRKIVAPQLRISDFPFFLRYAAAVGFAEEELAGRTEKGNARTENLTWLKKHYQRFWRDSRILPLLLRDRMITGPQTDALLEEAVQEELQEAAVLLEYLNQVYPPEMREAARMRKLQREMNLLEQAMTHPDTASGEFL